MPLRTITESQLKAVLMEKLRCYSGLVAFRLEDTSTSGVPDVVVTGGRKTSWVEVKLGRPSFDSKGIQQRTMERLEACGIAFYVIYQMTSDGSNRRTSIARPRDLDYPERWLTVGGFNHDWVVEYIVRVHR